MLLAYTRVSTAEQAKADATSLAEQVRKIKGFAMMQGIGSFDISLHEDAGVSGAIPLRERPAGMALLQAAGRGDIICAAKLDRMFRDALDAQEIYKHCKDNGIDLVLLDLGNESCIKDGIAKCIYTVISAFADMERWRIGERMADGRRGKQRKQGFLGGREATYGYQVVGKGREARLVPIPKEQEVVSAIVDLHATHTPVQILRELEVRKIRRRDGTPFGFMQIRRILDRAERTVQ